MKAKMTKDFKISIKLEASYWIIINQALGFEMINNTQLPVNVWWLMEEALEKISKRKSDTIKFSRSTFFTVFDEAVFQHIDEATSIIIWQGLEPLRKQILQEAESTSTLLKFQYIS